MLPQPHWTSASRDNLQPSGLLSCFAGKSNKGLSSVSSDKSMEAAFSKGDKKWSKPSSGWSPLHWKSLCVAMHPRS